MASTSVLLLSLSIIFLFRIGDAILPVPASSSPGSDPCGGDGWQHLPAERVGVGNCVKLFPAKSGWNLAEINCGYQGAHHVSVRDANENRLLAEMAKDAGPVWLGAAQFGQSRDYAWVDGTPFGTFEQWPNHHRPAFHRGRKCLKLDGQSGGQWVQSCCRVPAASICQRPAPLKVPGQIEEDLSSLSAQEREQFSRGRQ